MRYSFHGKVRANGQQVDGYVEAANATEAIDRLADRGIIGVYSVRPEPKPPKNAVVLTGDAEPEESQSPPHPRPHSSQQQNAPLQSPRLPQRSPNVVPRRVAAPVKPAGATRPIAGAPFQAAAPAASPARASQSLESTSTELTGPDPSSATGADSLPTLATPGNETLLLEMMNRLTTLMARVEQALARPTVMYQAGPVRTTGFTQAKKSGRIPVEVQSNTLHDIFQNNLDLRKSLDKLASTVGAAPAKAVPVRELAARDGQARDLQSKMNESSDDETLENIAREHLVVSAQAVSAQAVSAPIVSAPAATIAPREVASVRDSVRETVKSPREPSLMTPKLAV